MTVTTSNLIQGPAALYVATFGATEPATIATAPASPWIDLGGTKEGLEFTDASEFAELEVDQLTMTPERRRTKRTVTAKTVLAEATLENLARATANTAPSANVLTPDDGLAAFKPAYSALLIDGHAPGGKRRRIILRKTLPTDSVGMSYKKDGQTLIPITWTLHWVSASIPAFKIEDEPVS